ncbi:MAG: type III pantothenate kinase [Phycisphaerales bacterium]|nr:type III pantothenate kinase [Phycisphaerales bacterium]
MSHAPSNAALSLVAIQVGNTRTKLGLFLDGKLERSVKFEKEQFAQIVEEVTRMWSELDDTQSSALVLSSVHEAASTPLYEMLKDQLGEEIYRVEESMPVPIGTCVDAGTSPGSDRLLNAAAAFELLQSACIIVDCGTCVCVDFVDGEGVFHGGAIAPGARMQLDAMHHGTAQLPLVPFAKPEGDPWGANTPNAMVRGVYHGIRGLVWRLVEQYAERFGGFPLVVATGGDAALIFGEDELIDRIVPDLTLLGIAAAARAALLPESESAMPSAARAELGALGTDWANFDDADESSASEGVAETERPRATRSAPTKATPKSDAHKPHEHGEGCEDGGCGHEH